MTDAFTPFERGDPGDDDDLERWQVLADELLEAGDLRGESIALAMRDEVAWRELIDERGDELLGDFFAKAIEAEWADVEWRRGLIDRVRMYPWPRTEREFPDGLVDGLAAPGLRLVRTIEIGAIETSGSLDPFWDALPSLPTLRTLRAGGATHPHGDEHQITWLTLGGVGLAASVQPNLRELWARGSWPDFSGLDSSTLESLAVVSSTLDATQVAIITRARLPSLTRLELGTGDGQYGPSAGLDAFDELLAGGCFPRLVHLGICNTPFTNELVRALADSRILPRLRSIDLALGVLDAAGATELVERRARFAHLERIELGDSPLSLNERESLRAEIPTVTFERDGWWRDAPKSRRYCSISE